MTVVNAESSSARVAVQAAILYCGAKNGDPGTRMTTSTAWIDAVRRAPWLSADRATGYAKILAIAYLPMLVIPYLYATGMADGAHAPVDFMSFWSAGRLAWTDPASAYESAREAAFQAQAFGASGRFLPFLYPPPFLAVAALLAALPFAVAYPVWAAATWALFIAAARRLSPAAIWPVAVFPALYVNAVQGQTAALFTALFVAACLQVERRPLLAGLLFGALTFKPQLGLLIPLALAAGGYWRTFAAAVAAAAALLAGSLLIFGVEVLPAFVAASQANAAMLQSGSLPFAKIQSVFAALRQIGAPPMAAWGVQLVVTFAAAAAVVLAWRSRMALEAKMAILAAGAVVASPYLLDYDLVLLAAPLAWLAGRGARLGFGPWEKAFLALIYISPALCRGAALATDANLQPILLLAFFGLVALRLRSEPAATG